MKRTITRQKRKHETSACFLALTLSLEEIHGERGLEKPAGLHVVEVDIERLLLVRGHNRLSNIPQSFDLKKHPSSNLNNPAMKLFGNCCSELL